MKLRVKELCKNKGISVTELSLRIGIKQESLSRAINGNPTIGTLQKIADALDVEVTELFEKPAAGDIQCPNCGASIILNPTLEEK